MSTFPVQISEDRVRDLAHALWLEEGMPHGRAEAHWFKALELVNAEAIEAAPPETAAPAAATAKARKTTVKATAAGEAPAKPKKAQAARKAAPARRTKV